MSQTYELENGIAQGSVLSAKLFLIAINDVIKTLPPRIKNNLFVDDFSIFYASRSLRHLNRIMNMVIKVINQWLLGIGLQLAPDKTQAIVFFRDKRWLKNQTFTVTVGDEMIHAKDSGVIPWRTIRLGYLPPQNWPIRSHFIHTYVLSKDPRY